MADTDRSVGAKTSLTTAFVEERDQSSISGCASTQPDPESNHDSQNAPQSSWNRGSVESWCSCSSVLPAEETLPAYAAPEYHNPVNVLTTVPLLKDHSSTSVLPSPDSFLNFEFEGSDLNALEAILACNIDLNVSEEDTLASLSHLVDMQTEQPHENPKAPAPRFRADLLTLSPSQSAEPPVSSVLPQSSARTRKPEKHRKHKNIKPKSSCLDDKSLSVKDKHRCTANVPTNTPSVAESCTSSCDRRVHGKLPDFVPDKQMLEATMRRQVSQELTSSGKSSELGTRERGRMDRKCLKKVVKAPRTARPETLEKMKDKKEEDELFKERTNVVNMTQGQRRSGQTKKDEAIKNSECIKEGAENRKPKHKRVKKTVKFTTEKEKVTSEKPKRKSSGERKVCIREGRNIQEGSRGTETATTVKQFSEVDKQRLEAEEQRVADNTLKLSLLIKTPQEKKASRKGMAKREEGIQMSTIVRRRTKSQTGEVTASKDAGSLKHSKMERSEIKSSPHREILDTLDVNVKENAIKHPVSSLINKGRRRENSKKANNTKKDLTARTIKDTVSESCRSTSQSESSLQDTNTTGTADQGGQKAAPNKINKSKCPISSMKFSLKTSKKTPRLPPRPETLQRERETAAQSGAVESRRELETCDAHNSKSFTHKQKVTIRQLTEAPAESEEIKEHTRPMLSPTKRVHQEHEASQTMVHAPEKSGNQTQMPSPTKRAKFKSIH